MARTKSRINPHHFHLLPLKITCKLGFMDSFEICWEVRELMAIHRSLKGRGNQKLLDDIEMFLNSIADKYGYTEFDINENISIKNVDVRT